jgi:endonuclease/exonuclease/phosphatase family metal-dependent hydrolase
MIGAVNFRLTFYAWFLILFMVLMLMPARPWPIEIFATLLNVLLLPSIPLLIIYCFARAWRLAALWAVPSIVFVIIYGGLFLPSPSRETPAQSDKPIGVMTFNLYGKSTEGRQRQIDLIRDSGADIVALQEVSDPTAELIEAQLSEIYPYRFLFPCSIAGSGILSRYPMTGQELFHSDSGSLYHSSAFIDCDGTRIMVISAHPPPPMSIDAFRIRSARYGEINFILDRIPDDTPVLIMGDFNMTDTSRDYRLLTGAGLHDSFREAGWGFGWTWRNPVPLLRIDYIWHSAEFEPVWIRTGPATVSDHRPVIAQLVLKRE